MQKNLPAFSRAFRFAARPPKTEVNTTAFMDEVTAFTFGLSSQTFVLLSLALSILGSGFGSLVCPLFSHTTRWNDSAKWK